MLARALIVLLLILNLGVALWWATRADPAPVAAVALPPSAEPLRLLDESTRPVVSAAPAAAPVQDDVAPDAPADAPAMDEAGADIPALAAVCHAFGPFADAAAAERAREQLRPAVQRLSTRESRTAPRGWDVRLPGLADRDAAGAMATRLTAAGFRDHYILPAADDGRVDIALGRFGSEASAQRHRTALRAAGFEAVAEPIGDGGDTRYWIDVAAGESTDVAALRRATGAAQAERIDCGAPAAAAR